MLTMNLASLSKNPWLRRGVFCAVGLLLVWAVAWALVPPLLRHVIASRASEGLGRQVSVGEVDFRPWSLELTLRDLVVRTLDGDAEQLAVERLYIDAELQSLVRLAPVLDALVIERPHLLLTHTQAGHYDIDDLIALASKPSDPAAAPLRFALQNLSLVDGAIDFRDTVAGQDHHLTALQLGLPFLSNFDSGRSVLVQPHLAFQLNGTAFEWSAQATPFADDRRAEVLVRMAPLDLAPFLPYWPKALPVRLASGQLEADLKLVFEQLPEQKLVLSGTLGAQHVRVNDASGSALLAFPSLSVDLAALQPLQRSVQVRSVRWDGPSLDLRRDARGQFVWSAASPASASSAAVPGKADAAPAQAGSAAPGWHVQVDRIELQHARLGWRDEGVQPAAVLSASDVALQVEALQWPMQAPARFHGSVVLAGPAEGPDRGASQVSGKSRPGAAAPGPAAARVRFEGQGTDRAASVALRAEGLPLAAAAPYLAPYLVPTLQGRLSLVGGLGWRAPDLAVQLNSLTVDRLRLSQGEQELAGWDQLSLSDARIDLGQRTASAGLLSLSGPRTAVSRDAQGHWIFESWLKAQSPGASVKAMSTGDVADKGRAPSDQTPAWQWRLGQLAWRDGNLAWRDATAVVARKPGGVALDATGLQLQAGPFSGGPNGLGTEPVELQLAARLGAPVSVRDGGGSPEPGRLDYRGRVKLVPFSTQGRLEVARLPLHALEPYFGDALNLELPRADASFRGGVDVAVAAAGTTVRIQGDAALQDVRANSVLAQVGTDAGPPTSDELLSWKALSLRGIDLTLQPGRPLTLGVAETALSDFYARVVINDQGRINLQNLVRSSTPEPSPAKGAAAAKLPPTPPSPPTPAQAVASKPVIRMGPISLLNGRVLFSDRFVRPNYSASLSELTGRLGAFSSVLEAGSPGLADLELRGRAEGTASLEVSGKLNPLATPLALDIQGKVRELDLPPLSPYTIKYAGHGIERGKLSVNVAYKIDPDGQLNASNNIILNQLSFGEQVEGAPASLPVKLAVALLADRDGVIDINLPISGSLNDPDFRLAPIVGRLLLNLVAKAITSPFSLLANALGGGHTESNEIVFAPGASGLTPEARQRLDKVAQALLDRPALKLTVVGQVNVQVEREGYRRQQLAQMMLAEKRRQAVLAGQKGVEIETVTETEQAALLKAVYQRADLPKPRNLLGLAKDLPAPEMEALLLASVPVTDELLQALAVARGVVVRDYLLGRTVPVGRLFLGAAKALRNEGAWTPSAELLLDTR